VTQFPLHTLASHQASTGYRSLQAMTELGLSSWLSRPAQLFNLDESTAAELESVGLRR